MNRKRDWPNQIEVECAAFTYVELSFFVQSLVSPYNQMRHTGQEYALYFQTVLEKDPMELKVLERNVFVSSSEIKAEKEQPDHEVRSGDPFCSLY